MAMKWTENQQDAIEARRGTVLVAAAAGSGKTAVLVQRAIERLTDPEHPTPADKMLIVTFTKAAAAEMRARLERRLYDMLREDPRNDLLRRQSLLLSQASIGTVDSFCAQIVREFFHLLDVSPEFKILTDKQKEELASQAITEALNEAYNQGSAQELADSFAGERDDKRLSNTVLRLYDFTQSHPFPERWLRDQAEQFEESGPVESTPWGRVILKHMGEAVDYSLQVFSKALERVESSGDEKLSASFSDALRSDLALARQARDLVSREDWDGLSRFFPTLAFQRRGALRGYEEGSEKDRLEDLREEGKQALLDLKPLVSLDSESCISELLCTAPLVKGLGELVMEFTRRYEEKKRERSFLDYSDLEHLAIRLFLREDGSPTPTACEVSRRFEEIMIDEYQDVNETQDSLFRAISREGKNLFMVGDVKQSIYGFRQAMPEIFLRCRAGYERYDRARDSYPAYLVLDRNFRSRPEVTASVNFIFSQLMNQETCDIDYQGEESLVCGGEYGEKPGCETEVVFLERETGVHAEDAEPVWIAQRIRELMDSGFTLCENGEERPARWGDFCILLRSANQYAHAYAKALQARGVPARATIAGGFFAAPEVSGILSFLQVIDNPNQDIPLLSVLMSPVYGFTADDLARLRLENRKISLYLSLCNERADAKCARVIQDLEELRALASTMPSDEFLTLLYARTGYPEMVMAQPGGQVRLANLRLLQRYAGEYESSGYHGVSGFVRFLDRLRENRSDLEAAQPGIEGENAVHIMSIHKSKGLEFPVCIVAGCGRKFIQEKGEVLLHPRLGLGIKLKSPLLPARYSTLAREAIALETARDESAEELRVLYVAMTRAKEKLILLGSGSGLLSSFRKLSAQISQEGIPAYGVIRAKSAMEWLALCAMTHPDGVQLRRELQAEDLPVVRREYTPWLVSTPTYCPPEEAEEQEGEAPPAQPDEALLERLQASAAFVYPYGAETEIPAKVSASRLTAEQGGEVQGALSRPAWLGEQGLTPAQRGIALHDFMGYCDFSLAAKDPEQELERLVKRNTLTFEQAQAVEIPRVRKFFAGPLGQRVLKSPRVEKEKRFTAQIPAGLAAPGLEEKTRENVILQGAVDCVFEEGERIHIIDFKTDRVEEMEELWERYETQLRLYARAMEQITGKPVGELFLYSTWLGEGSGREYRSDKFGEEK